MKKTTVLVTGSAGFVWLSPMRKITLSGKLVVGIDNFNDYYDVQLKVRRNQNLLKYPNFKLYKDDICNESLLNQILAEFEVDIVYHLAAQAGVRYSIENPHTYVKNNIEGTLCVLESIRNSKKKRNLNYYSPLRVLFTECLKNFPFLNTIPQTNRQPCMAHQNARQNLWRIPILTFLESLPLRSDFSRFMDHGEDLIWPCSNS